MSQPITIIAEAAQGYEGDLRLARLLVRSAARARADLVKFQVVYADELATVDYKHHRLFRTLEMPSEAWRQLAADAREADIGIAFDVFGSRSLSAAREACASAVKIHTADFFNHSLVRAALDAMPAVYLSAGGIAVEELDAFLKRHAGRWEGRLTLLYGFQAEPTGVADTNLARLAALQRRFPQLPLGFMDHADGGSDEAGWLGVMAVPYGVRAVEKHITISRLLGLEDSVSALGPQEFAAYVARIRSAERAVGSVDLELTHVETAYRERALKAAVTCDRIEAGAIVIPESVVLLRAPLMAGRLAIRCVESALGRRAVRRLEAGQPIYEDDLE